MYSLYNKNMLLDPYKRPVSYLRVSVTDRCDFRCQYCMAENMSFFKKRFTLLQEIERICVSFINLGLLRSGSLVVSHLCERM